jgi:hypothetical protein
MVEKARRDGIRATAHARQSARDVAELRAEVQDLSSARSIDDWAAGNGFIPTDSAAKTGVTRIAVVLN